MAAMIYPALRFARFLCLLTLLGAAARSEANTDLRPLQDWISAQKEVRSLEGEFVQVRSMRALRKPLSTPGRFWYEAPDQFRWELGKPAKTVAVHSGTNLTVLDIEKKKAEVTDTSEEEGRVARFMAMTFPQTWESFQESFEVLSLNREGRSHVVKLKPVKRKMARGVKTITIEIGPDQSMRRFMLELKDGSEMETTFDKVARDVHVPDSTFEVSLDGYKVKVREP